MIRREKVGEVLLLVRRITRQHNREKGVGSADKVMRMSNGDIRIRRKAKDDSWW